MCEALPNDRCCEAINASISSYYQRSSIILETLSTRLTTAFPDDPTAREERTTLALAAYERIGLLFRNALTQLKNLTCDQPCCQFAAEALSEVSVSYVRLVLSLVTDPNIPSSALPAAIAQLIGPSPQGSLEQSIALILSTSQCPQPCQCQLIICEEKCHRRKKNHRC